MIANFNLINDLTRFTIKKMLEQLIKGVQQDKLKTFPNKKNIKPFYPAFEMFAFLLFQMDYLVATHQEQKLRMPLFNYMSDNMLEILDMGKRLFDDTLNKRMEEYGGIMVSWNAGEITDDLKTKKLVDGYLRNLTYSISEEGLFNWEGKIKPLPILGMHQFLTINVIYKELLLPLEVRLIKTLKTIFTTNSDFTQLSNNEAKKLLEKAAREIA